MRTKIATAALVSVLTAFNAPPAETAGGSPGLAEQARTALYGNPAKADRAIARLREAGPAGMEAMLALGASGDALDRVCGVRDCADIRLFWHTDLEAAKAAARAEGKPILSLRLLGRLDEELSCANSRFFRTVFYNNAEINELLRESFVLHWRSVRPVPKVTIDFGNGNRLEKTLTGNSIHYVLDSHGRLVDALPGLYGPEAFQSALKEGEKAVREAIHLDDDRFVTWAASRHLRQLNDRARAVDPPIWAIEGMEIVDVPQKETAPAAPPAEKTVAEDLLPAADVAADGAGDGPPAARDPWKILAASGVLTDRSEVGFIETASKNTYEASALRAIVPVSDDRLGELAQRRRPSIHLDPASRAFLLRKHGVTDPEQAERLVDSFEATVALDEVINLYRLGPAILKKLSDAEVRKDLDLEAFNLWVYEEVFRTPLSDPWLGLAPEDVYGALPAPVRTAALLDDRTK
jgi:hypothetical protein